MCPKFYEELVKMKNQEYEMNTVIRDIAIYLIYISIIFIISYGNRDPNAYLEKSALEQAIVFGGSNCDILPTDDPRCLHLNSFFSSIVTFILPPSDTSHANPVNCPFRTSISTTFATLMSGTVGSA
jgi:hypothetical protein